MHKAPEEVDRGTLTVLTDSVLLAMKADERPEEFGSIVDGQICSCTGSERALSRERVSVLGKGKDCRGRIEVSEFLDQLYSLSTAKS